MTGVSTDRMGSLLAGFRDRYNVPAIGAAIVTHDDLNTDVIGVCRRGHDETASVHHQWHIGSCAKSMTAALFARLVERGDAEWGTPLAKFFPDLTDRIAPEWQERTIDEVLVCQAGMRANPTRREMKTGWKSTASLMEQRTGIAEAALSPSPGRRGRFVYSNLGYIVVGAAIDRITSLSFEEALAKHVYTPLGITADGIGPPPDIWGHRCRLRIGNLCLGRGAPADPAVPDSDNPEIMNSAGRLHLTLADWARFHRIFLAKGPDFLQPETIEHLLTVPEGGSMAMGWAKAPGLDNVAFAMQGSNTLWSATVLLHRSRERTVLVACNDGRTRMLLAGAKLAAEILNTA